jgi:SSS family solute:Na+ symporter
VVIFGLGLLWKRASAIAAVVTAVGTFVFSILFKFMMPDVPFLLRMGYVFICLVIMFFGLSYMSKDTKKAPEVPEKTRRVLFKWAHYSLGLSTAALVLGGMSFIYQDLRDLGFEAFLFMGVFLYCIYKFLVSNALDEVEDRKSIGVETKIFKTDRVFNLGAAGVIIILVILYKLLW